MHWKKAKGKDYLFRTRDRYGNGNSLGPRSPETERILAEFRQKKQAAKERLASLKKRLTEQARFCKAAAIQRVPRVVKRVLSELDRHRLLGKSVMVIGTNALYAYEAAAGVFLDRPVLATEDMDILWDVRARLLLTAPEGKTQSEGFMGLLQKADRSFRPIERQPFRAANKHGYLVDLVKPEPRPAMTREQRRMGKAGDLVAAEIHNLQWLISSPKMNQVVIGEDGFPARLVCPDPRSFALHKLWLSEQEDRNPLKKARDRHQALAAAFLVQSYLPQYRFNSSELKMFPREVVKLAAGQIPGLDG
jgi:hypothetical protein